MCIKNKIMLWKYIIIGFLLVGFIFYYPEINDILKLPINYQTIVLVGSLLLMLVVTPLYWRAIRKQGREEKENNKESKQPWE